MKRFLELGIGTLVIASVAAGIAACNSGRDSFADNNPPAFEDPDAGGPPDAGSCGFRCSPDLKKVLKACEATGTFEVVAECPPNEGCGVDKCVDACTAAAMSKGSAGCSFWTMPADDATYGGGSCFAAMVANTWDRPVAISAEYGGDALDISQSVYIVSRAGTADPEYTRLVGPLSPGQVAVVFLAQKEGIGGGPDDAPCPKGTVPAVNVDPIRHGTTMTKAFHLVTDTPVAAYSIFPYGGADSQYPTATLLLPVTSWDKSYIAVATAKFGNSEASSLDRRTLQIIADEDGTTVSMLPNVPIGEGEGVAPGAPGEVSKWTLNKGQVLQITQQNVPAGSPIVSNKPIGMFGGSPCSFLPAGEPYCDLTQQQIAPFSQWGTSYALVPYASRIHSVSGGTRETVPWSFVGAVDGTELTYLPARPPGAPDRLDAGQVVSFMTDALVTVKSQDKKHPFHASVYMTGSTFGGGSGGGATLGDPDFVNVVPTDQYLDRYVFFTDFTYPDTSLTIVRKKTNGNFLPVKLECAGDVNGFHPLDGPDGDYEYAWVQLTSGFTPQKFASGECAYGRHAAESEGEFSITVWGWGRDASYGYAGGQGARPINEAPLPVVQ